MLDIMLDEDACYRALSSRDARFDGWFFVGVRTTGIYCRPSCPSITPKRANVRFYPSAAAAQEAGFRACKRCRPDASPGSPEWNVRADLVGRAMRHIADGVVDREGVGGLARRLGYSERHLHRQLVAEVGAGPIALARAQRAQTARLLLETSELAVSDVAFAAGFASIRQFNDTVREVFALTPSQLRQRVRAREVVVAATPPGPAALELRLPVRRPFAAEPLFAFLAARAVPGVESATATSYRRTLRLPHGPGIVELGDPSASAQPEQGWVRCRVQLADLRDLTTAVSRCRRLLDLDADVQAAVDVLGNDPVLGPAVHKQPGLRVPGHVDGAELAVRALLGQQVSVAGARTLAARLATVLGEPLATADGSLSHLFPTPQAIAAADPTTFGLTRARSAALVTLTRALADGAVDLDAGADRDRSAAALRALPGVGDWTVAYVRMRALGDPDSFMSSDLGVRRGLAALGLPGDPRSAQRAAQAWRPWRSYALQHVWAAAAAASRPSRIRRKEQSR